MVGRNVTFHEYSSAIGIFNDPIYAWAGGGYVSASSFEFYNHDDSSGFASGGHIACAGVGIPLPINWGLPDRPLWGADAKTMDVSSSTTAWRCRWWCTTCRSTTTGSSWTKKSPTPGICPSPGSR